LKQIFQRFHQIPDPDNINGSGIGLSLVKEYIDLHKGFIEVKSKVNSGTSIFIYLPKKLKIEKNKSTTNSNPPDTLEDEKLKLHQMENQDLKKRNKLCLI
jgi:hypothetical protein